MLSAPLMADVIVVCLRCEKDLARKMLMKQKKHLESEKLNEEGKVSAV